MATIFFYGPKLEKEKKKELVKGFTKLASKVTGIDESVFVVYLRYRDPEDTGIGGELLIDKLNREKIND